MKSIQTERLQKAAAASQAPPQVVVNQSSDDMRSTQTQRLQKAAAASQAPPQVVTRPMPALGLFIKAAQESAVTVVTPEVPKELPRHLQGGGSLSEDNPITMDTKFPVARKTSASLAAAEKRVNLITPPEYSGKLENKLNLDISKPKINWSSEAYSIFEGTEQKLMKILLNIRINVIFLWYP